MEATQKFNLPEDDFEYTNCNQASSMWSALIEMREYFITELKYNDNLTEGDYELMESVQKKFYDVISENKIILEL